MIGGEALRLERTDAGLIVPLRVQPRASADRLQGVHDGALKVAVTAPPLKGRANAAVIKLLARALGVAAGEVELVAGETSRNKKVRLPAGVNESDVRALAE